MVVGLDEGIKNVTKTIQEELGDNVLIIFSSDNGGSTWFGGLNEPLRSGKTTPYEGGVRVPSFAVDLSKKRFGTGVYKFMFHISDWLPTIMSFIGVDQQTISSYNFDGHDHSSYLKEVSLLSSPSYTPYPSYVITEEGGPRTQMLIDMYYGSLGEFIFDEDVLAYRKGNYKLIEGIVRDPNWYIESTEDKLNSTDTSWVVSVGEKLIKFFENIYSKGPFDSARVSLTHQVFHGSYVKKQDKKQVQLFNIKEDPRETTNLASTHPEIVNELRQEAEVIKKNRPAQQRFWYILERTTEWPNTFVPGDCSQQKDDIAPEYCRFTHPWFADSVSVEEAEKNYVIATSSLWRGALIRLFVYVGLPLLVILFIFCSFCQKK